MAAQERGMLRIALWGSQKIVDSWPGSSWVGFRQDSAVFLRSRHRSTWAHQSVRLEVPPPERAKEGDYADLSE